MKLQLGATWRSLLLSSLLCTRTLAKKDAPGVAVSAFKFVPWDVKYFDDSDTMLFEDRVARVVYRSEDAGASWKPVDSVPAGELMEILMHPFDSKRSYVMGGGKKHWMTRDRGKTWEVFQTDSQASLFREALTFHAGDPDRIIFNAMDCTGIFCEELVGLQGYLAEALLKDHRLCILRTAFRRRPNSSALIPMDATGPNLRRYSQQGRRIWMRTGSSAW